jgi:hypothetical protein
MTGFKTITLRSQEKSPFAEFLSGRSEFEYQCELLEKLYAGNVMDILTPAAQSDFYSWIEGNRLLDGRQFFVTFNFGDSEIRHAALHCSFKIDLRGDEPKILLSAASPGMSDNVPKHIGSTRFEFFLCDLDIV